MFDKESQWKRAERINLAVGAVGLCVFLVDLIWDPMPEAALGGGGGGMLAAAIMLYFVLYRRKAQTLSPDEQDTLIEQEQRGNVGLFWSIAATALCIGGLLLFSENMIAVLAFGAALAGLCIFILVTSFRGLLVARASRSNPGLFDERAEARFQKANATAFTCMLNAALIGGAIHLVFEVDIPAWVAFYGPALVGVLGMLWVMSRDDEAA